MVQDGIFLLRQNIFAKIEYFCQPRVQIEYLVLEPASQGVDRISGPLVSVSPYRQNILRHRKGCRQNINFQNRIHKSIQIEYIFYLHPSERFFFFNILYIPYMCGQHCHSALWAGHVPVQVDVPFLPGNIAFCFEDIHICAASSATQLYGLGMCRFKQMFPF